jgi:hypothetical protein
MVVGLAGVPGMAAGALGMVATPGAGVGVVAATVGTSPTVVARSATGGAEGVVVDGAGVLVGELAGAGAAGTWACAALLPSCWRGAMADACCAGCAGCAAAGVAAGVAPVAAGGTAHAASGIRSKDASSAFAPPLRRRADSRTGRGTWAAASYWVAGGQAGARVDIIYSIF